MPLINHMVNIVQGFAFGSLSGSTRERRAVSYDQSLIKLKTVRLT